MAGMDERTSVVRRTSALLRALSMGRDGTSTTELAEVTAIPRGTVHRLMEALDAEGLVDRDHRTGSWFLGPEVYVLGVAAAARYDMTEEAARSVHRLAHETGQTAAFSVRRGDEAVVLLREAGDFPIRSHVLAVGSRLPLGVASAGLALLAHSPDQEIDDYLSRTDLVPDWGESHDPAAVRRRIALTRAQGWALHPGLVVEGSWGLAAAVFDQRGTPAWALTLTGVESSFPREEQARMGRLLLEEAHRLSKLAT